MHLHKIQVLQATYEKNDRKYLAPIFKSSKTSIMVGGAFIATNKYYLVLIPSGHCVAINFMDIVCEQGLLPHFFHHINHEHMALLVDGVLINIANITKAWIQEIALKILKRPLNSPNFN